MTRIGIVAEQTGETRVSATPATIEKLQGLGYEVIVERGAGAASAFPDTDFERAGATIVDREEAWRADVVLKVDAPTPAEVALLADGATLIGLLSPALRPDVRDSLATRGITALALDAVPRISRAQSMDVLSSMANISGYRAVIEAAHEFGRFFTGQVTAAGKVPPAKVLVAGAGVAGTRRDRRRVEPRRDRAGHRPAARGRRSGALDRRRVPSGRGRRADAVDRRLREGDQRGLRPRRRRPLLRAGARCRHRHHDGAHPWSPRPEAHHGADVAAMRAGSVIVDMAAGQGGNVEGSVAGERIVTTNGVVILGYTDLAGRLPTQASQLYGTNLLNLIKLLTPGKDGELVLDFDDVVQRSITVVRDGESTWPPPAVAVSAAPAAAPAAASVAPAVSPKKTGMSTRTRSGLITLGIAVLFGLGAIAPAPLPQHLTVLVLAVVVGFYVIGHVHHALHTPLMSVTNAISGIIIVGAMVQITVPDVTVQILAAIAVLLASINIFGGFSVTRRMLAMFSKGGDR